MALSGVVLPVHPPSHQTVPTVPVNMAMDVISPPVLIKQEHIVPLDQEEYRTETSPNTNANCLPEESKEEVAREQIKEEAMEVDEVREETRVKSDDNLDVGRDDVIAGNSTESISGPEEEGRSLEQQVKNELMENERNAESRCSTGSTDDMWRPW